MIRRLAALALGIVGAVGGVVPAVAAAAPKMAITSPAFGRGEAIPDGFTCDGADASPPLRFRNVPKRTEELALVMHDPDAPAGGGFTHWVAWHLPRRGLPEETLPAGIVHGANGTGNDQYLGPCPPPGPAHHYVFMLYAVSEPVDLAPGATKDELQDAVRDSTIAQGAPDRDVHARFELARRRVEQLPEVELALARLRAGGERGVEAGVEPGSVSERLKYIALVEQAVVQRHRSRRRPPASPAGPRAGERRDAACQPVDERAELVGGQRPVHLAVALGELGVEVVAAEHDLERAAAPDQARQPLRAATAGDDPERDLGLRRAARDRARRSGGRATSANSLPPPRARPSICAIVTCGSVRHRSKITWKTPSSSGPAPCVAGERLDQVQVGVRDEELRVRRCARRRPGPSRRPRARWRRRGATR